MLLAIILGILLLLLLLLLITPTLLGIDFLQKEKEQKLVVRFRILGLSFAIPLPGGKKKKTKKTKEPEEKKNLTPKGFIAFAKNLYGAYRDIEEEFKELLHELKKRFSCREVYFTVHYGTKNPATTGILNGAVWTASSLILKVLDNALRIGEKTLDVKPDFTKPCFCVHLKLTLSFRLIDAIRLALKINQLVKIIKNRINNATDVETDSVS